MSGGNRIVLVAGGTGGHVFPARALAVELLGRGHTLAFITDRRGEAYGESVVKLDTYRLRAGTTTGQGWFGRLRAAVEVASGWWQAHGLMEQLRPLAVVGFGGYPALPAMMAALQKRLPTVIHEQNAVLGRANRFLATRVDAIAVTFAATARIPEICASKVVVTGNPIRPDLMPIRAARYAAPAAGESVNLLVLGGSQGASVFSAVLPEALGRLDAGLKARLSVVAQCRREDLDQARAAYAKAGIKARCAAFFDAVTEELARAHLVVARAGASTVCEIAAAGRPALLVPYSQAVDDHQTANAAILGAVGAADIVRQSEFTSERVATLLAPLLGDGALLAERATKARAVGVPDAAKRLADLVERLGRRDGRAA
ncbi:MAG: undecaprenyldiphospho-muramoylpentapeptide beta-N-acetylglucosaminyltransferase, partial [Alphaproteobacteria bacterium]|nr:undecaprenyldiphospho-muramoylpentapeptide beta-N-acetylglucosaminyltransferase [Alphaproteobacteria bacterium]